MINISELLPIGSVVLLKDGIKKLMIVGIYQNIQRENKIVDSYDYIGVLYPEGLLTMESMVLFNHNQINDVVFMGYDNLEREDFLHRLSEKMPTEE